MCIYSGRCSDTILFHHEGGVDIGDVDAKVRDADSINKMLVSIESLALENNLSLN